MKELLGLVILIIVLATPVGYIMNLYKLTQLDFREPVKAEIVRGAGVFVLPLGAVAGFITFDEEKDKQ